MMFSSTVIGLKLVPTTTLHHKRTGEVMTGVLLFQDLIAILLILLLSSNAGSPLLPAFIKMVVTFWFGRYSLFSECATSWFRS